MPSFMLKKNERKAFTIAERGNKLVADKTRKHICCWKKYPWDIPSIVKSTGKGILDQKGPIFNQEKFFTGTYNLPESEYQKEKAN